MQADLPHTLFLHKEKKTDPSKNTKASDEVIRLQEEANRQFLARREELRKKKAAGQEPYTTEELFRQ